MGATPLGLIEVVVAVSPERRSPVGALSNRIEALNQMNRPLAVSVIVLFWFAAIPCRADDQAVVEKKVKALIEQLASPNKAPDLTQLDPKYPADFDYAAQRRVRSAIQQLSDMGTKAFPLLLEHAGDKRYSHTGCTAICFNVTVGRTCFLIVQNNLEAYKHLDVVKKGDSREDPARPEYAVFCKLKEPKTAASWWKTRQDKSLRELQIETLEWVISQEKKSPDEFTPSELKNLREALKTLQARNEPITPAWLYSGTLEEFLRGNAHEKDSKAKKTDAAPKGAAPLGH